MELQETIEMAKKLAKNDYENRTIMGNYHNLNFIRNWNQRLQEDGSIIFGLSGTPDKAFVVVSADKKSVMALSQSGRLLKKFKVEE